MNAEGLLAALAQTGDEPAQVQKMRKVIVALAISGKLTVGGYVIDSSHAKDLDHSRTPFPALGKSSPRKKSAVAVNQEDLPEGFYEPSRFVRLGSVATIEKGRTGIKGVMPGPYPMVVTAAERITSDHYDFDGAAAIVPLVSSTGHGKASLHRLHYQEGQFALGTILAAIFPHDPQQLSARFLYEYLTTFKEELLVSRMIGTANVSLSIGKIAEVPVPLVDPSTQRKVDELMALCDQLEGTRAQREATRDRLAAASLARLKVPDPDTFPADARFALDALPALTIRPDQIRQLRQTILNLAVRGKLAPQDPNDVSALVLLSQIASSRSAEAQIAGVRIKVTRSYGGDSLEGAIPSHWAVEQLGNLVSPVATISYGVLVPGPDVAEGIPFVRAQDIALSDHPDLPGKRIAPEVEAPYARTRLKGGEILLCVVGSIGKIGIAPLSWAGANIARALVRITPHTGLDRDFLLLTLRSDLMQSRFAEATRTLAQPTLNVGLIEALPVPLPPLAEQKRIVAKVDELMALCDQLEASLTCGETTRSRLLDALLHEALAPAPVANSEHPRAAVSGYVVSRLASKRNFGRTAHMKHLYLAESRLGLKLGGRYMREAAGPLDNGIYALEKQAEAADWYTARVETLPSGKEKVSYMPGQALEALAEEGVAVLGPTRAEMDRLIDLMGGLNTEQVEIIATLFAAWNDALLDGQAPDDDWIVKEVREHWHVSKQRFKPTELQTWLAWMRQNDVIPLGHPPRTMQQTTMEL